MNGHANHRAVVWTSLVFVFLVVTAVESQSSLRDDADDESTTATVNPPSQADGQLQQMFLWTANPGRRRPLPPMSPSVQLVGVDVRRIQRRVDNTTSSETVHNDDASNSTYSDTDDDMALADQLRLARIR